MIHKKLLYTEIIEKIDALLAQETNVISAMATVICELHHGVPFFHWSGFYLVDGPRLLTIGPYQGTHGCLKIPFEKGVCGACARTGETQVVKDVQEIADHIACSASTQSEIVVPVFSHDGRLVAVLDIDSDRLGAFDEIDKHYLEIVCHKFRSFDWSMIPVH